MRKCIELFSSGLFLCLFTNLTYAQKPSLRDAFKEKFLIGVAVNVPQTRQTSSLQSRTIAAQFSSITPENCMKCSVIHPEKDRYDFRDADAFVKFGERNKQFIIGHCLIWHSQLAPWFCVDAQGNNVSADTLKARMKTHIQTVVSRYKGRIQGWDVVNEAIEDDGSYRRSKFYEILGEEFIPLAFQYAHEADPEAELYYNDYSMAKPGRLNTVVAMVKKLKASGVRIDGVGFQAHFTMDYPTLDEYERAIVSVGETGCKVMITEMDLTALPPINNILGAEISQNAEYQASLNPYVKGLPKKLDKEWTDRMNGFFKIFCKHAPIISRVTVWGLTDGNSWRNDWPMAGRIDYPLLFDRDVKAKPIVKMIIKEAKY